MNEDLYTLGKTFLDTLIQRPLEVLLSIGGFILMLSVSFYIIASAFAHIETKRTCGAYYENKTEWWQLPWACQ